MRAGMSRFHELVARFVPEDAEPSQVLVCIETDRGPWVRALVAAGYRVFGVNLKQAARHREIIGNSGAKSDKGDAYALADMVRTRRHQLLESPGTLRSLRPSTSSHARIRRCCGNVRGTCYGCGWRCGTTFPPCWRPTSPSA